MKFLKRHVALLARVVVIGAIIFGVSLYMENPDTARAAQLNLVVTSNGDNGGVDPAVGAGTGTLRQAIIDANAASTTAAAPHTISFNIPGGGVQTIALSAVLPAITQPTSIDGATQPGAACGNVVPSIPAVSNTPHTLMIAIDGSAVNMTSLNTALISTSTGASGSVFRGLSVYGMSSGGTAGGALRYTASDVLVECSYFGLRPDGTAPSNNVTVGLHASQTTADNSEIRNNVFGGLTTNNTTNIRVVGTTTGAGVITNTSIHNNLIGTNPSGTAKVGTATTAGIYNQFSDGIVVADNVISGNTHTVNGGFYGVNAANATLRGNIFGADLAGTAAIPNYFAAYNAGSSSGWVIGGPNASDRNYIVGNTNVGISATGSAKAYGIQIENNYVGLLPDGVTVLGNGSTGINLPLYSGAVVKNNVVVGSAAGYGINASGTSPTITGNLVGILPSGVAAGNYGGGVSILSSTNAVIGGASAADRNVISGNNRLTSTPGLLIGGNNNGVSVKGNYLGVGIDGITRVPNGYGITVNNANTAVTIGGSSAAERNVVSGNTTGGMNISNTTSTSGHVVIGNYFGLDKNGDAVAGATGFGISVATPNGLRIGGSSAGESNVISGNPSYGISMTNSGGGQNFQIYGNIIGLKPDGTTAAGNGIGVYMYNGTAPTGSVRIGGSSAGQGNVISSNTQQGIQFVNVVGSPSFPTYILNNKIGVAADGTTPRGNANRGVFLSGSSHVVVGGVGAGEGNTIAYNTSSGVYVAGASAFGDNVRGNNIYANTGLGIDLVGSINTPEAVDINDVDTGVNGLQNFSRTTVFTRCDATTETRTVLRSAPNSDYTVDFYANPSGRDISGYGEGEQYHSSTTVSTDSKGYAEITPPAITDLSMTATDASGSTSEFSNLRTAGVASCTVTNKSTNDASPSLAGTLSATNTTPTLKVTVDGQTVDGVVSGGTWTVGDNVLSTLASGTYDVTTTYTDPETTMTTTYTKTGALTIDTDQPTATIARRATPSQPNYTQTNSAWFSVVLSEDVTDASFTSADISLGTTTGSVSTFTKIDETHYEFEVTGMTSGDTVTPSIPADAFTDLNGNVNSASTSSPGTWVMYDTTAPQAFAINVDIVGAGYSLNSPHVSWSTVDNQSGIDYYTISYDGGGFSTVTSPQNPTLTPASSHTVIVRAYDKAGNYREKTVLYPPTITITAPTTLRDQAITDTTIQVQGPTGMIITDVTISGAGSSGFTCTPLPSLSAQVPINCSGGSITSTGTLTVTATSDGGVTTDNSQDYVIDTVDPTVTINQAAGQNDPTNADSARYRVVFSESINESTFSLGDIQLSGTSGTVTTFTKIDNRTWDIEVTGMTHDDTVIASLAAGAVQDPAGNTSLASTTSDNQISYDNQRPTVTIDQSRLQADPTNINSATFTIEFSEPVTGFDSADIHLTGTSGTVTSLTNTSGNTWEAVVTGMTSGDTVVATIITGDSFDVAGNSNTASTSTDNAVTYDATPPTVTVRTLTANSTSPALSGTINDLGATVTLTVNGTAYPATNNGDGTWTLAAGTISPALAEGTYDVQVQAVDSATNAGADASTNELVIDLTTPTGTVDAVTPSIVNSPRLSGTVNDPAATISVTINGTTYSATNNGDGTWTLAAGTISPALTVGSHDATVTFTDAASNSSEQQTTISILRADADLPTITATEWIGGKPVISGTYDAANSQSLSVRLNGITYVLGVNSQLTASGNSWTLNLTNLSAALGDGTYDVTVSVTTRDGSVLGDTTQNELKILAPTIANAVTNPTAGTTLASTGVPVWVFMVGGLLLIAAGALIVATSRRSKNQ